MARRASALPFTPCTQREKVKLLHPCLHGCGKPRHQHMLQSKALCLTMVPTQTHADAPRRVFVSAGSHTPHQQLRRYISVRCEDGGSVPQPSKVSYHWLMWGHI